MECNPQTPAAPKSHNTDHVTHLPSATQLINGSTADGSGDGAVDKKLEAGLGTVLSPLTTLQSFLVGYAAAINKSKAGKGKRKSLQAPVTTQPSPLSPPTPRPDILPTETSRVMAARRHRRKLLQMERMVMLVDRRDVPSAHEVLPLPRPSIPDHAKSSPSSDAATSRNGSSPHVGGGGVVVDTPGRPAFLSFGPAPPIVSHSPVFASPDRSRYRTVKTRSSGESVSAHLDRLVRPAIISCLAGPPLTLSALKSAVERELQAAVPTAQRASSEVSTGVASAMTGFNLWFHRLIDDGLVSRVSGESTAAVVSASSVSSDTLLSLCGWENDVGEGTAWLRASTIASKERRSFHPHHASVSDEVWCPLARLHASPHPHFHISNVASGPSGTVGGINSTAARLARISHGSMVSDVCASAEYITQCIRHPPELVTHPMNWTECVESFAVLTEEAASPEHKPANGFATATGAHIPPLDVDASGTFETPARTRVPPTSTSEDREGLTSPTAARVLPSVVSPLPKTREKNDVLVKGFKAVEPPDVLHIVEDKPVFVLPCNPVPTSLPAPQPPVLPAAISHASPPETPPTVVPLSSEAPSDANDLLFTSPSASVPVLTPPVPTPARPPSPQLPDYWIGFGEYDKGDWRRPISCWDTFQKPSHVSGHKSGKIGFARGRPFVKADKSGKPAGPVLAHVVAPPPPSDVVEPEAVSVPTPTLPNKPGKPTKSAKKRKAEAKQRQEKLKAKRLEEKGDCEDGDDSLRVQVSDGEDTSDEAYARRHVRMNLVLRRRMAHAQKRVERAASMLKTRKPPKSREEQQRQLFAKAAGAKLSTEPVDQLVTGQGCEGEALGSGGTSGAPDDDAHANGEFDGLQQQVDEGMSSGDESGSESESLSRDGDSGSERDHRENGNSDDESSVEGGGKDEAMFAGSHQDRGGKVGSDSDSVSERRQSRDDDDLSDLNDDEDDVDELRRQLGLAPALTQGSVGWLHPSSDSYSQASDVSDGDSVTDGNQSDL